MFNFCLRALLSLIIVPAILLLSFLPCAQGNTEIVNFVASPAESPDMAFPDWLVSHPLKENPTSNTPLRMQLTPSNKEIPLNIEPVLNATEVTIESGVWLTLDLDNPGWGSYDKFTLRASWSAAHPCDIHLKISDPLHVASQLLRNRPLHPTRRKYVHVYAINVGVPAPSSTGEDMTWLRHEPVPITLVLEPLLFGVIPQSVVPVIFVLLVAIGMASALLPYVLRYYGNLIEKVQQEVTLAKRE